MSNKIPHQPNKVDIAGRSMTEMIGVLAVMGVLTITGIQGYHYALLLNQANEIIRDVTLAYQDLQSTAAMNQAFYDLHFKPVSGRTMKMERFISANKRLTDLIHVYQLEEDICRVLFKKNNTSGLKIFEPKQGEKGYQDFTQCQETNQMTFTYETATNGSSTGCEEGCPDKTHCDVGIGCVCNYGYIFSPEDQSCIKEECVAAVETNEIHSKYCCDQIKGQWQNGACSCGAEEYFNGTECVPSQGFCVYAYRDAHDTGNDTCAYLFSKTDTGSLCSYTFSKTDSDNECIYLFSKTENNATCSYTFTQNENQITATPLEKCPGNEYCTLQWKSDQKAPIQNDSMGTLYGTCARVLDEPKITAEKECPGNEYCTLQWETADHQTPIKNESFGTLYGSCSRVLDEPKTTEDQACPDGEYCTLQWETPDRQTPIKNESFGKLYGSCSRVLDEPNITELQACPNGGYCNLQWESEDKKTPIKNESFGKLYGSCSRVLDEPYLHPVGYDCNQNEYCYLLWASDSCQPELANNANGLMYGVCVPKYSSTGTCPLPPDTPIKKENEK